MSSEPARASAAKPDDSSNGEIKMWKARCVSDTGGWGDARWRQPSHASGALQVLWAAAAILLFSCPAGAIQTAPQPYDQSGLEYLVDPPAEWVQRASLPGRSSGGGPRDGALRYRLIDAQLLLSGSGPQRYFRGTTLVLSRAGLEDAARVDIAYHPQYETLTLHSIAVLRGTARMEKLPQLRAELMRREVGLEAGIYDGVVTASFTLDDVRIGDSIDVEYTLAGINPALGGRYNRALPLVFSAPVDLYRLRVLADASRPVQVRAVGSSAKVNLARSGERREWQLRLENVAATRAEDDTPVGARMSPRVEISEFKGWAEVAQWADALYRVPDDLSPELRAKIAELRAGSRDARQAVRRALKLVQEEVRYVGVEIGEGSYRPAHPNDVYQRRYGDCKDKSVLLAAILRGLGVHAYPALISTSAGRTAADWMAMPALFDHVIVQVQVTGQTYWLDPTLSHQEGELDRVGVMPYHWALVTGQAATRLVQMQLPPGYRQGMHTRFDYTVADYRGPVELKATVAFSGALAERLRQAVATAGAEQLADELFRGVRRLHPGAVAVGPPEVRDETEENRLSVMQPFSVPELFEAENGDLRAGFVALPVHDVAEPPAKLERVLPLALPHPFEVTTDIDVQLPDALSQQALSPLRVSDDNVDFTFSRVSTAGHLQLSYALAYKRDQVPARDVGAYVRTLREIRGKVAYWMSVPGGVELARKRALRSRQEHGWTLDRKSAGEVSALLDREQEAALQSLSHRIGSERPEGAELAEALVLRGIAYSNLQRLEEALGDLDGAIRADPEWVGAYLTRGEVYTKLGRYDVALADFEQVRKLAPATKAWPRSRGHAHFLRGDFRAAQADFRRVVEDGVGADRLHGLIWLYLSTARLGQDARAVVSALPAHADLSRWPGPALMLLLGKATPEEMLASTWSFERRVEVENLCEAYFFLGQYRLLAGDREGARRAFEDAVATGVKHYLEYGQAQAELRRLTAASVQMER
jgi:lipoprotein NlpI